MGATGLMVYGSHMGGEGVYLKRVAVDARKTQAEGIEYFMPARETHVLLSGLTIAVALGALGASLRIVSTTSAVRRQEEDDEELRALEGRPAGGRPRPDEIAVMRTINPEAEIAPPRIPSARFWLLSCLLALTTFGLGMWLMIREGNFLSKGSPTVSNIGQWLLDTARATKEVGQNRRGAHIAIGVALIVLPLVLAAAVRWGARRRIIVSALCLVMVLVVAAEIWLGVLLISDRSAGPLYRFVPDTDATVADTR
jgi:hypothetical protein